MAECPICYENMNSNVSKLICGHVYHEKCINTWGFKQGNNNTCPLCRETIEPEILDHRRKMRIQRISPWNNRHLEITDSEDLGPICWWCKNYYLAVNHVCSVEVLYRTVSSIFFLSILSCVFGFCYLTGQFILVQTLNIEIRNNILQNIGCFLTGNTFLIFILWLTGRVQY